MLSLLQKIAFKDFFAIFSAIGVSKENFTYLVVILCANNSIIVMKLTYAVSSVSLWIRAGQLADMGCMLA